MENQTEKNEYLGIYFDIPHGIIQWSDTPQVEYPLVTQTIRIMQFQIGGEVVFKEVNPTRDITPSRPPYQWINTIFRTDHKLSVAVYYDKWVFSVIFSPTVNTIPQKHGFIFRISRGMNGKSDSVYMDCTRLHTLTNPQLSEVSLTLEYLTGVYSHKWFEAMKRHADYLLRPRPLPCFYRSF